MPDQGHTKLTRPLRLGSWAGRIALAAVLASGFASSAVAYWGTPGIGSGTVTAAVAQPVGVSPGTPTAQLYPGGRSDVALVLVNPNAFAVHVGLLALEKTHGAGGFGVDASHPACDVAALSFLTQTGAGAGWSVPPRIGQTDGSVAVDLVGALGMSRAAPAACEGASFAVYLSSGP